MALSEHDLQVIERRVAAASDGPWWVDLAWERRTGRGREHQPPDQWADVHGVRAPDWPIQPDEDWHRPRQIIETDSGYYPPDLEDAAFIAGARQDVPALLAEVRRLQGLIKAVEWDGYNGIDCCPWCMEPSPDALGRGGHAPTCPAFGEGQ
jgi:hypothetical protein